MDITSSHPNHLHHINLKSVASIVYFIKSYEMEELLSSIRLVAKNERLREKLQPITNNLSYHVNEESDLYGFSCMTASHASSHRASNTGSSPSLSKDRTAHTLVGDDDQEEAQQPYNILDIFRNDENWNNPGAIELMMKSYDLDKTPHLSVTLSGIATGDRPSVESFNFMEVKASQYRMLSSQKIDEAMVCLQKTQIANAIQLLSDAIKLDKDNVNSLFLRAKACMSLMDYSNARQDILTALELTPDTPELLNLLHEIEQKLAKPFIGDRQGTQSSGVTHSGKLKLAKSVTNPSHAFTDEHDFVSDVHSNTIAKLRSSLENTLEKLASDDESRSGRDHTSSSSSSDSETSSTSDDSDTSRSHERKRSKRRRKSSSSKHSKHRKKDKKHHKEKKKSKRKSHKKKSRHDEK